MAAHLHIFDLHPNHPTMVACTVCGFAAPAIFLKSKTHLEAIVARKNATQDVLDLLGIDRAGNHVQDQIAFVGPWEVR